MEGARGGNGEGNGVNASPAEEGVNAKPKLVYVVAVYLVTIAAGFLALDVFAKWHDITLESVEGFAPFAAIYIVAQALERGIQPLTWFLVKAEDKQKAKTALAVAKGDHKEAKEAREADRAKTAAKAAAAQQKRLQVIQADRALVFWGLATSAALLICGYMHLGLIESIAKVTDGTGAVPHWFKNVDIIVTGVAIGSGTKPLHDLIAFIQNTKQKTEPVTQPTAE